MSFVTTDRNGAMESDPPSSRLDELVSELDGPRDDEHPDVSVAHESGWSLSAFPTGMLIWENVKEDGIERRVSGLSRDDVWELFGAVSRGEVQFVDTYLDRFKT